MKDRSNTNGVIVPARRSNERRILEETTRWMLCGCDQVAVFLPTPIPINENKKTDTRTERLNGRQKDVPPAAAVPPAIAINTKVHIKVPVPQMVAILK